VCVCARVRVRARARARARMCVCVCVCVCVTYGHGSVLWHRSDKLSTSGFMDDAIFARKPRLLDIATQLKHSAHVTLSLALKLCSNTSCRRMDAWDYFLGA